MTEENHFRQKLYRHTMPVREGVWDAIATRLPTEKQSRRFPFFWLMVFASAAFGASLMLGWLPGRQIAPGTSVPESVTSDDHHPRQHTNTENTLPYSTSTTNEVTHESASRTSIIPQQATPQIPSQAHPGSSSSATGQFHPSKNQQAFAPASLMSSDDLLHSPATPDAQQHLIAASSPQEMTVTSVLPLVDIHLAEEALTEIGLFKPDPNCYKFGKNGLGFAISADVFAGPGFSPRSFEDSAGESSMYAQARTSTERHQYAWGFGGRINLHLSNGIGARLGILYQQAGDLFDYRDSLAMQSTTRVDSFWAADGTFLFADTVRVLIPGTLVKKIHNTYRQVDIPLLLSYELVMGRAVLMLNAGPVLNLTSSHRGQILDPMLHPRVLAPGGSASNQVNVYKNQLGWSLYLGAGAIIPMANGLSVLIEPRVLYRIKPVTLPSYPLNEKRHFAGLNLGLRYHFK